MRVRQVTMTPELAETLMGRNRGNRILTPYRVSALADALRENRFVPEASGAVVVGQDDRLHDGQHRLAATIESGVSWQCVLIEGAPDEARLHYDTGKRRSFGDYLRMSGITNAAAIASMTRLLWIYDHGGLDTRAAFIAARSRGPDHAQLWEYFQKNEEQIRAGLQLGNQARRTSGVITMSVAGVGATVLLSVDEEDCRVFYGHLAYSSDDMPGPVVVLIRALQNLPPVSGGGAPGDQQHMLALLFKGWNHWRDGTRPTVLAWKLGGRNPERFPKPH